MTVTAEVATEEPLEDIDRGVTSLELFFDLVFVFAITQVTSLMGHDPTWRGLGHGLLVLVVLWWTWAAYAWLTNAVNPDQDVNRLAVFASMAALLIASLAVPRAFAGDAVLFACAYFVVRALHIVLFARGAPDVGVEQAIYRLAPTMLGAALVLLAAGLVGSVTARWLLWCVAIAIDIGGVMLSDMRGWRISPGHFAERHGLFVIIALGESIVAVGVGASELDAEIVVAALLGIVIAAALWWAYFDVVALVAQRKLSEAEGLARVKMARDSYSVLHLPMVGGIVLLAFGIKMSLAHIDHPLATVPAIGLCGGVAMYFLAHVAFRLRNVHTLSRRRVVVAVLLVATIPLATHVDALAAVGFVAVVCAALIAYETVRYREARARVRARVAD